MKKLMLSAAGALILLAAPALAQPGNHSDSSFQRPALGRQAQHPGQQRAQQPRSRPAQTNRPAARPAQPDSTFNLDRQRAQSQRSGNQRSGDHRSDNRRSGDHRPGARPGNQGNRSNYRRPYTSRNHAHADWSRMRNYHRNYRASRRFHAPSYHRPSGWYARRWSWGDILPSLFWSNQYWINDYGIYDLPPPPPGTVWVRNGDDAILIDRYNGEIIQVAYGIFY
jgi:Ni/Co efflux regulator RcnB